MHEYKKAGIPVVKGHVLYPIGNPLIHNVEIFVGACVEFNEFKVSPFEVPHDVPCYGYQIEHPDMGKLVFVTDAEYVKYTFPEVNHIMVEANYAQDIIDENVNNEDIPKSLRDRIMKSHMSFDTAKGMIKANKNPHLHNVIMCHLSSHNSDPKRFRKEMQDIAGQFCNVTIAKKGVEVDLSLVPF